MTGGGVERKAWLGDSERVELEREGCVSSIKGDVLSNEGEVSFNGSKYSVEVGNVGDILCCSTT